MHIRITQQKAPGKCQAPFTTDVGLENHHEQCAIQENGCRAQDRHSNILYKSGCFHVPASSVVGLFDTVYVSFLYNYAVIILTVSNNKVNQGTAKKNARNLSTAGVCGGD